MRSDALREFAQAEIAQRVADPMLAYADTEPGTDGPPRFAAPQAAHRPSGGRAAGGGARSITAFIAGKGMKGSSVEQKLDQAGHARQP